MIRIGLYVSAAAVRVRWHTRTRTIAWPQIASVDVAPAQILGMPTAQHAIWLTLTGGQRVETPVQRRASGSLFEWR